LKVAIEHGWDVVGVEPESIAVEFAKTHFGVRVIKGSLQEALKQKEHQQKFDAVSYLQSFEHVSDPVSELHQVKQVLKPTGILFLAVPNFNYLGVKVFGKKQFNIKNPTHVYHYTCTSLHHLLEKTGFRNIQRLVYWGGGRKQFGWSGQTAQWFFRTVGISSEIRVVASP
jgi:2-polyprenyl-3-methyl-5-hydroxy-6-metoxy-1,4-benzoquinol methylase